MATPQPGYPQPGHEQYQQENYDANQHDVPETKSPAQGGPPQQSAKDRRKRQYAGQAYDFGGGANSALGGQQQGGGQYSGSPGGGYGQQGQQPGAQVPGYGSGPASPTPVGGPGYGQQPSAVGGYQPPETGYPTQGAPPSHHGTMAGITQGMGNMAMGGQQQHQAPQMQGRPPMNQLYPTDLLNQAVNVPELDLPPPPIILPPNVSNTDSNFLARFSNRNSLALHRLLMRTVHRNTFVLHSMQFQLHIRYSRNLDYPSLW